MTFFLHLIISGDQDNTYENDEYKDLLDLLPDDLVMRVQDCVLDNKRMTLGKVIGQGQFGTVYVGTLLELKEQQHEPVAIKTLKGIIYELSIMCLLIIINMNANTAANTNT